MTFQNLYGVQTEEQIRMDEQIDSRPDVRKLACFRCGDWFGDHCSCSDNQTIFHGDCREILPLLPKVDLVIVDPPYGISHKSHGQIFAKSKEIAGDESTELAEWIRLQVSPTPIAMFFSPYKPLSGFRNVLVWNKGEHVGIGGDRATCWKRDFELIGVENNGKLNGQRDSALMFHPALLPPPSGHFAEKPVGLIRKLIHKLGGKTILDPCMGSGATLEAARIEGRCGIGIEREIEWCEYAASRLANEPMPLPFDKPKVTETQRGMF